MLTTDTTFPGYIIRNQFIDEINKSEKILKTNPDDINALTSYAHAYINMWCYGFILHSESIPQATEAVKKVLQLDPQSSSAHSAMGIIKESNWDWNGVEEEFKLAVDLAPTDSLALNWYSNFLYAESRFDEAYALAEKAVKNSSDQGFRIGLAAVSYFAQDFERLKKEMLDVIKDYPDYAPAYDWLGMAYIQLKEFDNSIEVYEKAASHSGRLGEILGGLGHAYGIAGNNKEATRILDEMNSYQKEVHMPPIQIAFVHAGMRDKENTMKLLTRAFNEKSWELVFVRTEPWFEHMHNVPEFRTMIEKMKFPK